MATNKPAPRQAQAPVEVPAWLTALEMVESDEDVKEQIGERIMSAGTVDDVLAGLPDAVGLRNLIGHTLTIHGATLRRSDLQASVGAFAVIDATDHKTGERLAITCGGENVLRQLVRIQQLDGYPFDAVPFETESKSNPGQTVLWLRAAEKPFD